MWCSDWVIQTLSWCYKDHAWGTQILVVIKNTHLNHNNLHYNSPLCQPMMTPSQYHDDPYSTQLSLIAGIWIAVKKIYTEKNKPLISCNIHKSVYVFFVSFHINSNIHTCSCMGDSTHTLYGRFSPGKVVAHHARPTMHLSVVGGRVLQTSTQ